MKWDMVTLHQLAPSKGDTVSGPFGSNIGSRFFVDEGVPVIRGNNLTVGGKKFIDNGFVFLTETKAQEFTSCEAIANDIVITAAGSIGQIGIIPEDSQYTRYIISNKQIRVRVHHGLANPMFVYYWLSSSEMTRYIVSQNNGGAVPLLNLSIIRKLPVPKPPKDVQDRIVNVLAHYDNLIENNRRRIELLEQTARLLYKEWFVHFRFPGHEHVKTNEGVPERWKRGQVSDFGEIITGKTPSTKEDSYFGGDIPFVKTPDMHNQTVVVHTEQTLSESGAQTQNNKYIPKGALMVSCIGTLGVVSIASQLCQTNQQINSIVLSRDEYRFYAYFVLSGFKQLLEGMGGGATMGNVNKTTFSKLPVVIPLSIVLQSFHDIVSPIFAQIETLERTSLKLRLARDLLLSRLMNGEIAI